MDLFFLLHELSTKCVGYLNGIARVSNVVAKVAGNPSRMVGMIVLLLTSISC